MVTDNMGLYILLISQIKGTPSPDDPINWWMWIAVIEYCVILILLYLYRRNSKNLNGDRLKLKKESLKEKLDFSNIVNSSFNAEPIYNELIRKCHPDRFPLDEEKNKIASELSALIVKNKHDINKLNELKKAAQEKLGINF